MFTENCYVDPLGKKCRKYFLSHRNSQCLWFFTILLMRNRQCYFFNGNFHHLAKSTWFCSNSIPSLPHKNSWTARLYTVKTGFAFTKGQIDGRGKLYWKLFGKLRPFPGVTRWLRESMESLTPVEYPWDNDHRQNLGPMQTFHPRLYLGYMQSKHNQPRCNQD